MSAPFAITVSDGECYAGEFTLAAPTIEPVTYYLGESALTVTIPKWLSEPYYCGEQVQYAIPVPAGDMSPVH
jgi:hypothetical protein